MSVEDWTGYERALSIAILSASLNKLPAGYSVQPNSLGNLAILDADGFYTGYIDMRTGEVEIWTNEK